MRWRARGFTLVELMVTAAIFTMITILVLWTYTQGFKANRRYEQGSEVYRRSTKLFGILERTLDSARVLLVRPEVIVFHPHLDTPVTNRRSYAWGEHADSLVFLPGEVQRWRNEERQPFIRLEPHETLEVTSGSSGSTPIDFVEFRFASTPPAVSREGRTYELRSRVVLDRY